jgi:hypothetical protein
VKSELRRRLAEYLRLVAGMLDAGAMDIEFYNSSQTSDPSKPDSQSASLNGEFLGAEHGFIFNSWSRWSGRTQAVQSLFKDYTIKI